MVIILDTVHLKKYKKLRIFLEIAYNYRRFIRYSQLILAPIYAENLVKKNLLLTSEVQEEFQWEKFS